MESWDLFLSHDLFDLPAKPTDSATGSAASTDSGASSPSSPSLLTGKIKTFSVSVMYIIKSRLPRTLIKL